MADAPKKRISEDLRRLGAAWNTDHTRLTLFMVKEGDLLAIRFESESILILEVIRDANPLHEDFGIFQVLNQSFSVDLVGRKLRIKGTGTHAGRGKIELGKRVLLSVQNDELNWEDFVPISPVREASLT